MRNVVIATLLGVSLHSPAIGKEAGNIDKKNRIHHIITASGEIRDTDTKPRSTSRKPVFHRSVRATTEVDCLATTVFHEAEGEKVRAKKAVALSVINRVKSGAYPDNVCKVVAQRGQYSWVKRGFIKMPIVSNEDEQAAWAKSIEIAQAVVNGEVKDFTSGATHFHAHYVSPKWKGLIKVGDFGGHAFYRTRRS